MRETVTPIVPLPFPAVGLSVSQLASVLADHSQSRGELTEILAVPPSCGIVRRLAVAERVQRADDGPTTSVSLVTPPHPDVTTNEQAAMSNPLPVFPESKLLTNMGLHTKDARRPCTRLAIHSFARTATCVLQSSRRRP